MVKKIIKMADATNAVIPLPPGGQIEIVFSFDTTGSMHRYLEKVRTDVVNIITRLLDDVPSLRIAVLAHGDYCDEGTYITKHIDFSRDLTELCDFVKSADGTAGGDFEECYELVLKEIRTELSWQPGTQRALVMIGDAVPHEVEYYKSNKELRKKGVIDWKKEVRSLHEEQGVHIYAVQCGGIKRADHFWNYLADNTAGMRLILDNFNGIIELIMAICYRETGPDVFAAYEREIRDREGAGLRKDLDAMFGNLRTPLDRTASSGSIGSLTPLLAKADSTSSSFMSIRTKPKRAKRPISYLESDGDLADDDSTTEPAPKRQKVIIDKPKSPVKITTLKKTFSKNIRTASGSSSSLQNFLKDRTRDPPQHRELSVTSFNFTDLPWSRWQLAMAPKSAITEATRGCWDHRIKDGLRNVALFENERGEPAVYELAIQPSTSVSASTKHPVLLRTSKGFKAKRWDKYLLRDIKVLKRLDKLLKQGHRVYLRRAVPAFPYTAAIGKSKVTVTNIGELRRLMTRLYDYSWKERRSGCKPPQSRPVIRSGVKIS